MCVCVSAYMSVRVCTYRFHPELKYVIGPRPVIFNKTSIP